MNFFCNTKVAGLGKIFLSNKNFHIIYSVKMKKYMSQHPNIVA